jgi:hypothetical protein
MHAHADRIRNLEMADGTFGPDAAAWTAQRSGGGNEIRAAGSG